MIARAVYAAAAQRAGFPPAAPRAHAAEAGAAWIHAKRRPAAAVPSVEMGSDT